MGFQRGVCDCSFPWGAAECARVRRWGVRGCWQGCEGGGSSRSCSLASGAAGGPGLTETAWVGNKACGGWQRSVPLLLLLWTRAQSVSGCRHLELPRLLLGNLTCFRSRSLSSPLLRSVCKAEKGFVQLSQCRQLFLSEQANAE